MLVPETKFDSPDYSVEKLFESPENIRLLENFTVSNKAYGLEAYLKNASADDERNGYARTYLVKDKASEELACYFSLRTGLITLQVTDADFATIPAVELSNFAVNDTYRKQHKEARAIGRYSFEHFILPIARFFAQYIGMNSLYIYALPDERLLEHYAKLGFSRLPADQEKFVQVHVKPKYDEGCIFMYQTL